MSDSNEQDLPSKNPGTSNNNERSGDRDNAWSELMRKPAGVRSCDFDVFPICPRCKFPIMLYEVKRTFPSNIWAWKHSEYVRNVAGVLRIPAYYVHHETDRVTVVRLKRTGDMNTRRTFTKAEFVAWVEGQQEKHVCQQYDVVESD